MPATVSAIRRPKSSTSGRPVAAARASPMRAFLLRARGGGHRDGGGPRERAASRRTAQVHHGERGQYVSRQHSSSARAMRAIRVFSNAVRPTVTPSGVDLDRLLGEGEGGEAQERERSGDEQRKDRTMRIGSGRSPKSSRRRPASQAWPSRKQPRSAATPTAPPMRPCAPARTRARASGWIKTSRPPGRGVIATRSSRLRFDPPRRLHSTRPRLYDPASGGAGTGGRCGEEEEGARTAKKGRSPRRSRSARRTQPGRRPRRAGSRPRRRSRGKRPEEGREESGADEDREESGAEEGGPRQGGRRESRAREGRRRPKSRQSAERGERTSRREGFRRANPTSRRFRSRRWLRRRGRATERKAGGRRNSRPASSKWTLRSSTARGGTRGPRSRRRIEEEDGEW